MIGLLLLACSADFTDEDIGTTASGLPDLLATVDDSGCDDLDGVELAGAVTWYWGEYVLQGDGYTGEERLLYFANDSWKDAGGSDCEIVWQTTAVVTNTGACGSCDTGLTISAALDGGQTTCEPGLTQGEDSWDETYGLALHEGGTASWYFAGSGNLFATGYHNDSAMNYLSEVTCSWFGG